ncbi:hypothetical protein ACFWVF_25805 [Streptomyces sp. NPDC058659]|uniref:hypothetical protein n=1 Tax=unclassified Streptomyces TaxID=2593676 RepID=UPI003664E535
MFERIEHVVCGGNNSPGAPPEFVLGSRCLAGELTPGGEEYGEGLGVGRVQGDGQQGGAELVDPVPEAVPGESPPQARTQHRRVLDTAGRTGWRGRGRCALHAFTQRGDGGRDDPQELGGLRAEIGQRPGEYLQRGGRVLDGSAAPPIGSGGVGESAHGDHRVFGQRVQEGVGVLHVPPNEYGQSGGAGTS